MSKDITRDWIIKLIQRFGREKVRISLSGKECKVDVLGDDSSQIESYSYAMKKEGELDDIITGELEIADAIVVVPKKKPAIRNVKRGEL